MIVKFRVPYGFVFTPEQRLAAQEYVREPIPEPPPQYGYSSVEGDALEVSKIIKREVTIEPQELMPTMWETILERLRKIETGMALQRPQEIEQSFNQRVNVHVPNLGLLLINEARVEENCCTDRLTSLLEAGWRILAICPQPDQRRPDYIIGRVNP